MTAEPDLLPCPGCNGASVRVIGGPGAKGGPQYWAGCDHCRWRTWGNTEADAIAAWNTRATTARDAEIESLRAEVERLTFEMGCLQQQYDERTACTIVHRGAALACSDAVRAAYYEEYERAERLAEALEEIRSRSSIYFAMQPDPSALTARLGDIYQIADAALSNGGKA